jgi:hypothetical protein
LQASNQQVVDQIVKELESQAHFVSYAPPKLVAFRQGIYLELSLNSTLPVSAAGSRYKLAAMAFDDHISHLICPLLNYFKDEQKVRRDRLQHNRPSCRQVRGGHIRSRRILLSARVFALL